MRFIAPAKVNLSLHITKRRADNYHELNSLVAFTDDFGDEIEIAPAEKLEVVATGRFAGAVNTRQNSIMSAANWFSTHFNVPGNYRIHVEKNIPAGGGLGGGTSDAATVVRALAQFHGISGIEPQKLVSLGADVPVSYYGRPCVMRGIGEIISPVTLERDYGILLINPNLEVSTAEIFRQLDTYDEPLADKATYSLTDIAAMKNTLETTAISLCPAIGEIIEAMHNTNAALVRMTGSGATVFALCEIADLPKLEEQANALFPNYWNKSAQIKRSTT